MIKEVRIIERQKTCALRFPVMPANIIAAQTAPFKRRRVKIKHRPPPRRTKLEKKFPRSHLFMWDEPTDFQGIVPKKPRSPRTRALRNLRPVRNLPSLPPPEQAPEPEQSQRDRADSNSSQQDDVIVRTALEDDPNEFAFFEDKSPGSYHDKSARETLFSQYSKLDVFDGSAPDPSPR